MQAQTKSQEICMRVRLRSLRLGGEEAALVRPLFCGTGGGAGTFKFDSPATAGTAFRLRVVTLGSDTLMVCPSPLPAAGARACRPPRLGNDGG